LGAVTADDDLGRGCRAHADYRARNLSKTTPGDGARLLDEEPGRPGFSDEGKAAARVAMLHLGDPAAAVEHWLARVLTRLALLQSDLRRVGVGIAAGPGGDWIVVLDAYRGRGGAIVLYPAPDQHDVPVTFAGGPELPDAEATAGYPITVTFPPTSAVTGAKADVRDADGRPVECVVSTPDKPLRERAQRNTVALIPKSALRGDTVYHVEVSARVDGRPWSRRWQFTTEDDGDRRGEWAKKALAKVNGYRTAAGLAAVELDDELTSGCRAHARYLATNLDQPATRGLGAHDEDPKLPGYTEAGQAAGKASDIAIGDYDPLNGIDAWMATLYHRVPMLEPNLKTIGFGCARGRRMGWIAVLNVGTGRARGPRPRAVFYPAPDQADVPLHFPIGGEEPNPIPGDRDGRAGYAITAFFPDDAPLKNARATLTDADGKAVPCWFSSPERVANDKYPRHQGNTVCLIPKDPLRPDGEYQVSLAGTRGGKKWDKQWRFRTGAGGPAPDEAAGQVLERLNALRRQGGVGPVELDPVLGKGCRLHAEYLVDNAEFMDAGKRSVNDEDPARPGFTAAGLRAAKQSDVFSNAPAPAAQIDDLAGTVFRRTYLLDPALRRVGVGCAQDVGRGWRCVLDLNGGRGDDRVVIYPAPKQRDVPAAGADRSAGYPITVFFPPGTRFAKVQANVTGPGGEAVPFDVATPAEAPGAIAVTPREPLRAGTRYNVTVSALTAGGEWRQSWAFTTAGK
jgi:uncharacterized protein YkwD